MLKKSIIIWLVTFLGHHHLVAQEISQQALLADSLTEYGKMLLGNREYDSAISILSESLFLNSTLEREIELGKNQNDIGVAYHNLRQYDSAIVYYSEAKTIFLEKNDTVTLPITLANLGMLYKRSGKYEKALENLFIALRYNLVVGAQASTLNTIGSTYTQTGQYDQAVKYYLQAIKFYEELGNQRRLGIAFNNLGNAFNKLEFFDSAISYFNRAIAIKSSAGDEAGMSRTLNNLGLTYLDLNKLDEAESALTESLKIKRARKDSLGIANTLNLIAKINLANGNLERTKTDLDIAHRILEKVDAPYELRENIKRQAEYYSAKRDWLNESRVLKQYISLNDSLLDSEKVKSLAEMQVKYESEKKDGEISYLQEIEALQKVDISFQKSLRNIYFISASLFGSSLLVVVALLITNRNKKKRIEQLNQEMQHRIKNNLQMLSGILKLQGHGEIKDGVVSLLKENESRVNAMAIVHQLLYADTDKREIAIKAYIKELCDYLKKSFVDQESKLSIETEIANIRLDVDKMVSIGLIINELVTNAMKHAFDGISNPKINIRFTIMESGNLLLEVRDSGRGFDVEEVERTSRSFGIKLIRMMSKQLDAELVMFNEKGTVFQFSIPPK